MATPTELPVAPPQGAQANVGGDAAVMSQPPMHNTANRDEPHPPSSLPIASSAESEESKRENEARPTDETAPQPHEQQDLLLEHMEDFDLIAAADQDQWLELISRC
jgi:hypothetical protein